MYISSYIYSSLHSAHGSVSIHEAGVTSELGPPNNAGKESRPGERELDLLDKLYNWHGSHSSLSIHGRPYSMDDGRTRVYIAPVLTQLIEFDVKKQMLEGHFAVAMVWTCSRICVHFVIAIVPATLLESMRIENSSFENVNVSIRLQ